MALKTKCRDLILAWSAPIFADADAEQRKRRIREREHRCAVLGGASGTNVYVPCKLLSPGGSQYCVSSQPAHASVMTLSCAVCVRLSVLSAHACRHRMVQEREHVREVEQREKADADKRRKANPGDEGFR